jgi:hypothetical protein
VPVSTPLERICCANPRCPAIGRGGPRLLLLARLPAGAVVEPPKCRSCGWVTRLTVRADGTPELWARPARAAEPRGVA